MLTLSSQGLCPWLDFSWIVSPFETGGVVIALELTLGAVIAGPFDVPESDLSARIEAVVCAQRAPAQTVH